MKKYVTLLMILVLVMGIIPIQTYAADGSEQGLDLQKIFKEVINKTADYFKQIANRFSDMGNHWANVTVGKLVELGILDGYGDGTFRPNNTITRAEFAKVVRTSLRLDTIKGNSFNDTKKHWAKDEIHTLVKKGIILPSEYGDNYEPDKNITRIEMAKMIVRAVGLDEKAKELAGQKTKFNDDNTIKSEDKGYIIIASQNGIINGYPDNTFKPCGEATRAEASQMIVNMFDALDRGIDTGEEGNSQKDTSQEIKYSKNLLNTKYVNADEFEIDENGEITIQGNEVKGTLIDNLDEKVIKVASALVEKPYKENYVEVRYYESDNAPAVIIGFTEKEVFANIGLYMFSYAFTEKKFMDNSIYDKKLSSKATIRLSLKSLSGETAKNGFVKPEYRERLEKSLVALFGEVGRDITDYAVEKLLEKREKGMTALIGVCETKTFGNIQVDYWNHPILTEPDIVLYFTIK
ncbi:S-layer homology domain-containing protein [Caloranaerobacter azorensis DSM 13643]|uniref:S-layer homology domain-containing protein n=1 Tax=Caloranaerobacter azorensis DSM 13643 TaxID=1121264 RepID=A0A1M5S1L7_9FIRM|nr:S-layer homology domain-containing protein [Caloranaerobacter azorensis]SHH32376.1 S-layer homology domain-containing protein [Caloranaerobacter azorensis DSM 13643]